jgi:LPS-assembly protein
MKLSRNRITHALRRHGRRKGRRKTASLLAGTAILLGLPLLAGCIAPATRYQGSPVLPVSYSSAPIGPVQAQSARFQLAQEPVAQDWSTMEPEAPAQSAQGRAAQSQIAQGRVEEPPSLISADNIVHDDALSTVTASGNVEISHEGRTLRADTVSYNTNTDIVSASGNVSVTDRSGDVLFADFVELTGDLREGFIRDIRVLMSDRSRLAAASARRGSDGITLLRRGVFSPCALCKDNPTRAPLWQLKAVEAELDSEEEVIRYRDAWMEFYGVPVFYTPYFEHPSPTVERKSGFLAPTFGNTTQLGLIYQQPYYWTLAPNRDFTFSPMITTKQGPVLAGEFRELLPNAKVELEGSMTVAERENADGTVEDGRFRGHIDSTFDMDINETFRGGFRLNRATDDTYLRLYNFSDAQTLTSRAFLEGFDGRNFAGANAYVFQGLRQEDQSEILPIVAPLLELSYLSEPLFGEARARFDGDFLALHRAEGSDTRRLAGIAGLEVPFDGLIGDRFLLTGEVTAGGYWSNDLEGAPDPTGSQFASRLFPMAALDWRYPWARLNSSPLQMAATRVTFPTRTASISS